MLQSIPFFNRREGYPVSSAGLVLHTQDSGATWKWENPLPLNCSWADVHFVEPSCAWAVETHKRLGRHFDPTWDAPRASDQKMQAAASRFGEPLQVHNPVPGANPLIYSLLQPAAVQMEIYDLLGRRVRVLEAGVKGADTHSILWNLRTIIRIEFLPAPTSAACASTANL